MRLNSYCIRCLLDRQQERIGKFTDEEKKTAYMKKVAGIVGDSGDDDAAPLLVYRFNQVYQEFFGEALDYSREKEEYNSYVMALEDRLYQEVQEASDPLAMSIIYARIGNYIDFGAMQHVEKEQFLKLFHDQEKNILTEDTYRQFMLDCENGKEFLLLTDNCGEIVLDKLFVKELKKRFPHLHIAVMVRGSEVLNDATYQDAVTIGMCEEAEVVDNGNGIAGTVERYMPKEAVAMLDRADVILSKGQANFETMNGCGRNVYYSFLCKCDWFSKRFQVPKYTGLFLRERDISPKSPIDI